jgi:hypothetical protein
MTTVEEIANVAFYRKSCVILMGQLIHVDGGYMYIWTGLLLKEIITVINLLRLEFAYLQTHKVFSKTKTNVLHQNIPLPQPDVVFGAVFSSV